MRIALLWPFGRYQPGDVVDVDHRIAAVLTREGFARTAGEPAPAPQPKAPTVADLKVYAAANGCSLSEARDRIAADRAPRSAPLASSTKETPCA